MEAKAEKQDNLIQLLQSMLTMEAKNDIKNGEPPEAFTSSINSKTAEDLKYEGKKQYYMLPNKTNGHVQPYHAATNRSLHTLSGCSIAMLIQWNC